MNSEIEASNTMYALFHVKNCFNKIILLLSFENSLNRYLIKKNNYTEFIYIPINLNTHYMWATKRLEMEKLGVGWGEVQISGARGRGWRCVCGGVLH